MAGNLQTKTLYGLAAGACCVAISTIYYYWYRFKPEKMPEKWKRVGYLDKMYFYPIKSCGGIAITEANCQSLGILENNCKDHMFMIINTENRMVSARIYPKMLKIQPNIVSSNLTISAPEMETLKIDFNIIGQGEVIEADIFKQSVFVVHCGHVYDQWVSKFILGEDQGLKLVYYAYEIPTRHVGDEFINKGVFRNDDTGTLQDVSSYMLINEQSMIDLNTRLKTPIDALQFRPNFLIKTNGLAYAEDKWEWIKIGNETIFRCVGPCVRCIIPNIDPKTAERNPEGDPLKTLKSYRVWGKFKSPRMGLQLGIRTTGSVKLGDDVFVQDF